MLHVADTNQLLTQPSGLSAHGGAKGNEDMGGQPRAPGGGCSATSFLQGFWERVALTGKTELKAMLPECQWWPHRVPLVCLCQSLTAP